MTIERYSPHSGRVLMENNATVNFADALHAMRYKDYLTIVDVINRFVDQGYGWSATHYASVSNDGYLNITIKPPANTNLHLFFNISGGGDMILKTFKNPTITTGQEGTDIVVFNRRTDVVTPSNVICKHTPTITNNGTARATRYFAFGTGGNMQGGQADMPLQTVVCAEDTLLFEIQNKSGKTIFIDLSLDWLQESV